MAKAVKVEKIIIEIANTKLELTKEQAEELKTLLVDLLGDNSKALDEIRKAIEKIKRDQEKEPITIPIPYPQPYPVPYEPWVRPRTIPWWEPTWICTSDSSGTIQFSCRG